MKHKRKQNKEHIETTKTNRKAAKQKQNKETTTTNKETKKSL